MNKIIGLLVVAAASLALLAQNQDALLISTAQRTVTETESYEWRTITFYADPVTGAVNVRAVYEKVNRTDGVPSKSEVVRDVQIPWSQATNIAPALVLVREQFRTAMPTILTNTP
jgi:hypothetical protein